MNLFNIPGLNNAKTALGSWTQIAAGLLLALAQLLKLVSDCVNGVTVFQSCLDQLPLAFLGVIAAANGLANLGIGHKIMKLMSRE